MNCPEDGRQRFILLPALARKRFKSLLASQEAFTEASENSWLDGSNIGIMAKLP